MAENKKISKSTTKGSALNPEKPYVLRRNIEELYARIELLERRLDRTQGCLVDLGRTLERFGS